MKYFFKKLPQHLQFIVLVYLSGMIIFSILRLLLFLLHFNEIKTIPSEYIFQSMVWGFRFDTVINGYFLALPLFLFFISDFFRRRFPVFEKTIFIFICTIYSIGFFVVCADIPWFNHQQTRLTIVALQWTDTPMMMLKIVFEDIQNYPFLIAYFLLVFIFYRAVKKIKRKTINLNEEFHSPITATTIYLFACAILFLGIRGRVAQKSPIRWGSAFVSQYNLTNQLGLNPVYTFTQSWLDSKNEKNNEIHFMDETTAIQKVQQYYGIEATKKLYSPVARKIISENQPLKLNVVLVIMESLTTRKMGVFGNSNQLTPHLDSIAKNSMLFTNFYSDGIHTFNGVFSSLFGLPSLPLKHHMKDIVNQQPYNGIAKTLSKENYQTIFFTTHDDQFDNVAGFLSPNGFQKIISQKDYPQEKILSTLGVPDHVMFDDAVARFNLLHQNSKPFFAAFMTGSDHGPYEIPDDISFHPHSSGLERQATEYADWAVGHFLNQCSKQSWFDSTVFIFTGDHGALIGDGADHYLSYHHVPLIIFAPKIFNSKIINNLGGQTDIFPTLLGLLNISYINNSFGINLLNEERKYFPFTYDNELGCISDNCFCILQKERSTLFKIHDDERCCDVVNDPQLADSMITFSKAVMQTMQSMIRNRQVH